MTVTISDIAVRVGVSHATVSRVLNSSGYVKDETREKVLKAIKDLNYTPSAIARSLSTSKTNTIGVIVPDINNLFFGEIIKGVTEIADENNLNIILCNTDENKDKELKAINVLKEQRIQGLIITPTFYRNSDNSENLNVLKNLGIPIILIDGHVEYLEFSGVFIDHIKGAYDGTLALIEAGHRKMAIITGDMKSRPAKERLLGYEKALEANNIPIDNENIFYGDYTQQTAYEITKKILKMDNRPTAIFVSSNTMILGCIKALYEEKINIPRDMAIIGFDKVDVLNIIGMNISFVNGPSTELGRIGMKMLLENMNSKELRSIKRQTILPELILKGSEKYIEKNENKINL
ncbi:LacI family transcriptional regulator [Clostridium tagluense]|uniref:LacI family DNA-binding transcriptional regulator n=1 Tax=Clostridium TaxID=1485 RepID=UPI0013E9064C|nr:MULTISPECIES: LacI family DNA-binding transcriptional regulator [Clostridium]MBW9156201.1 LacI family transcriptional regulator [Clostridium tagluense]MBZ9625809.1 LacI family transcriptional regulator [Clostridium sp. FP2]MCB2311340.1 LacI family transcriptional regulator [Clostridium tagluense]MCB2316018.1 LacI family transcriptional regulator [Clostridium tagluense]MCB2320916.1 LacI family transcriptional regulator [Clostridium tagluense]